MKTLVSVLLAAGVGFAADSASDVDTLKKLEHEWTDAQKARDVAKLSSIMADDWIGLGFDGNRTNKQDFLAAVKAGSTKLESFTFGDMDVKFLGNVAVVQGGDTEKSSTHGEDTSGKWVWTDVFVKKDGRWQAVRSQSARVR